MKDNEIQVTRKIVKVDHNSRRSLKNKVDNINVKILKINQGKI